MTFLPTSLKFLLRTFEVNVAIRSAIEVSLALPRTSVNEQGSTVHAPLGSLFQAQWENCEKSLLYTSALA